MRALCWHGRYDVRVETVEDPKIINPQDVIVQVTATAICGSDLHLYDGVIPGMEKGDILGHEFMGIIVDAGREVTNVKVGDRVVVPFTIACGSCFFCERSLWSACDNSNPNATLPELAYGQSPAGIYGYSHIYGGYAGGQAEYVRVPFANSGPFKIPDELSDEQVLFLTDIFPTGYMAAENCNIQPGDVVAVWGAGPVGQFAIRSAYMLGAGKVIAIDNIWERLRLAQDGGAETLNFEESDVVEALKDMTGGRGPDSCIDAVGMEAHGTGMLGTIDKVKHTVGLQSDRPTALRQAIQACRKGGTVSIPGVYGGFFDHMPMGAAFNKGLTFKMGQTHVQRYLPSLLSYIQNGEIDPTFVISHRLPLEEAPQGYELFKQRKDGCTKIVLRP